ncbi:hypothetical protein GUITHDRAFT_83683, partial [Guillardia theta CCMP2712]
MIGRGEGTVTETLSNGDTPLHVGVRQEDVSCMQVLIEQGANLSTENDQGQTCAHLAILEDHVEAL